MTSTEGTAIKNKATVVVPNTTAIAPKAPPPPPPPAAIVVTHDPQAQGSPTGQVLHDGTVTNLGK